MLTPQAYLPSSSVQNACLLWKSRISYARSWDQFLHQQAVQGIKSLQVFNQMVSGFITSVVGKVIAGKYVVRAHVRYSQRMNDPLVNIWVISENDGTILSAHCFGRKAGLAELTYRECSILFRGNYTNSWQARLHTGKMLMKFGDICQWSAVCES